MRENRGRRTIKKRRVKRSQVDFILLITTLMLVFIGFIMVFSSSWPDAMGKPYNNEYHFVKRQIIFGLLGFVLMIVFMNIDYKNWKKNSFLIYLLSLGTVALLFTPLGTEHLGARRWVNLGPIGFMPGDVVKLGSIIFFSNFLANKKRGIRNLKEGFIPAMMVIGVSLMSIYIQRDLGTTLTLAGTMMAMFIIAGMNMFYLLPIIGGASSLAVVVFRKAASDPTSKNAFRVRRIMSFLDPFEYSLNEGYQAVQSLYALGSGGIFGLGLGKSRQKFFYIPEPYNDFIFAIIGEELGFIGSTLVMILYVILIWRGIKIAINIKDDYGRYLATGITALVAIQTLIHISVVTSSIPTTGITLPFISYGGTSLVIYMIMIGILLNLSRYAELD